MSRGWGRWVGSVRSMVGNVRSMVGNSMGGLRGGSNLASWAVAGTLAYYLWVKPSQDLKRRQQERAQLAAASQSQRSMDKPEVGAFNSQSKDDE